MFTLFLVTILFISAICLVTSILSLSEEPPRQPFWIENSQFLNDDSVDSDNSDDSNEDDGADPLGPHGNDNDNDTGSSIFILVKIIPSSKDSFIVTKIALTLDPWLSVVMVLPV